MNKVIKTLKIIFFVQVIIAFIIVLVHEASIMPVGWLPPHTSLEFVLLTVMELLTVALIPLALRLFKFKKIGKELSEKKEVAFGKWGVARISMLAIPMLLNTLFYYMFMSTTFGYMAIILLLCMVFIYPSKDKCYFETRDGQE
jgi:hypothetical protein